MVPAMRDTDPFKWPSKTKSFTHLQSWLKTVRGGRFKSLASCFNAFVVLLVVFVAMFYATFYLSLLRTD